MTNLLTLLYLAGETCLVANGALGIGDWGLGMGHGAWVKASPTRTVGAWGR
ncbi:hypothetical protein [Microcoleus sp. FACHB-68]|uniref:hypothetical protein n=1 Tax=Microcoleus sp. FACHB-68 TaxID=2692826 RepID=UPI0016848F6A|nr:hypothetical protein [Microcoleus sp. FACHB-68]MBD1940642.1 hypothetical protein [Microcoleus sp. FACHB-68]